MERLFSRRRLVIGLTGVATAATLCPGFTAAKQPGPTLGAKKSPEPGLEPGIAGIQLFRDWMAGKLAKVTVPLGWVLVLPPRGVAYFAPNDWAMIPIDDPNIADFADGNPFGSWIVSPDELAGVLMVNISSLTRGTLIDATWRDVTALYPETPIEPLTEDAIATDQVGVDRAMISARIGEKTLVVIASSFPDTVLGGLFIYYNLAIADTTDFDNLTESVFLPLLMNLVPAGGGGGDDDDDDDDDDA